MLGGSYGGIFMLTEAAAVAAVYAFLITVFVYKELKHVDVPKVLLQAANMSAMLLYIITNSAGYGGLYRRSEFLDLDVPAGG